jgi:hypothetical protein
MSSPTAEMNLAIPTTIEHGLVGHVPGGDRKSVWPPLEIYLYR